MKERERVVLTADVPAEGLKARSFGTVIHVYRDGVAYEVAFAKQSVQTSVVVTLKTGQLRPIVARREDFAAFLNASPDVPPIPGDELPDNRTSKK